MENEPLKLDGVSKSFRVGWKARSVPALSLVSLSLAPGRIVGLLGPNGAGKSTTIGVAIGFLMPDSGTVRLFGRDPRDAAARSHVAFLPEVFEPHTYLTPRELLTLQASIYSIPPAKSRRAIELLLESCGLSDVRRPMRTLSKGMSQRVGIACALLPEPRLLILDEPSSGLDPEGRELLASFLRRERNRGCSVLLSSHLLADIERLSDEVVIMREGKAIATISIGNLDPNDAEWELRLDEPSAKLLRGAPSLVHRAQELNGGVLVTCSGRQKDAVLDLLAKSGLRPSSVHQVRSPLERAYGSATNA